MSKKQLPKRNVSFKLEKHPTAERLERLRAQGVETLDDLERLSEKAIDADIKELSNLVSASTTVAIDRSISSTTDNTKTVAIDSHIDNHIDNHIDKQLISKKIDQSLTTSFSTNSFTREKAEEFVKTTDIDTSTAISSKIDSSINKGITSHIASHIAIPIIKIDAHTDLFNYIQQTHSSSAQIIYKLLNKLSNERARQTIRIGTKELLEKTKIKSHVTVRKAIDELVIKCSVEIVEANQGKIPPVYKLIALDEVLSRREEKAFIIDEDTKFLFQSGKKIWPNSSDQAINSTIALPIDSTTINTILVPTSTPTSPTTSVDIIEIENQASITLNKRVNEIKGICRELGVEINDLSNLTELDSYPLSHIIIGICRKAEKSAKNSLTVLDCLEEIREHFNQMNALPESILSKVAYDDFLKAKQRF
ncbi:MAG: hypothetical protein HY819_01185 [Acidobacteria bacterium]|nr:hypothetical protein [Acidobacteriota bacterium]